MASDTSFYSIVILVASILLIVILTYLGIEISKRGTEKDFPPDTSNCPDYWPETGEGICEIPLANKHPNNSGILDDTGSMLITSGNTYGLDAGAYKIDFNNEGWAAQNDSEKCTKKKWADQFGIVWDGITNFNKCN